MFDIFLKTLFRIKKLPKINIEHIQMLLFINFESRYIFVIF